MSYDEVKGVRKMSRFVCSFFGLSIYSVLVYIGARIAQLLDHLDDGRWHSNVMKYVELWQIGVGFVLLVCTITYLVKWFNGSNS